MKLTKRQIQIVENFIKKETRRLMKEGVSPEQAGQDLAEACKWNGRLIAKAFLYALTDANFESERKKLAPVINQVFGTRSSSEG